MASNGDDVNVTAAAGVKEESDDSESDSREACKYGTACYQKNSQHLARFKHPVKDAAKVSPEPSLKRGRSTDDEESIGPSSKKRASADKDEAVTNVGEECERDHVSNDETHHEYKNDEKKEAETIDVEIDMTLTASPLDVRANIKQKFLVEMPDDFYSMFEFCQSLNAEHPEDVFESAELELVGPFDVLAGSLTKSTKQSEYLCHYRYYYDPPEFQTVIKGADDTQYHIGYFRDSPDELPAFVGFNEASKNCVIKPLGDNLFAAVNAVITEKIRKSDVILKSVQDALQSWAKTNNFRLQKKTSRMKERDKTVVAKGFHGAGIVVPFDKKLNVGYRPLPETDENLRKILRQIVKCRTEVERAEKFTVLQNIITLVQFANDECDYGMGYELALALFCYGHSCFHRTIELLMSVAYSLLNKPVFYQILKAHLRNRVKDSVSVINRK